LDRLGPAVLGLGLDAVVHAGDANRVLDAEVLGGGAGLEQLLVERTVFGVSAGGGSGAQQGMPAAGRGIHRDGAGGEGLALGVGDLPGELAGGDVAGVAEVAEAREVAAAVEFAAVEACLQVCETVGLVGHVSPPAP
jgi:hypothetical protein